MEQDFMKEDRSLSPCESVIMKAIWEAGEDIALLDLIQVLKEKYNKDYARTTVTTFLVKLSDKDYVRTYRKGKSSYIHPIRSLEEYKVKLIEEQTDIWYQGQPTQVMSALCKTGRLTKEDIKMIRGMIDGLDN